MARILPALLISLLTIATAVKTLRLPLSKAHPKKCFNIGSWFEGDGPFEAELGFVTYKKEPRVIMAKPSVLISRTNFGKAFLVQRVGRNIMFSIRVSKRFKYMVTTAHAEIVDKFCRPGARIFEIRVNGQKKTADVFKAVGCRAASFFMFANVKPDRKGIINIWVKGLTAPASVAGICVSRMRIPGTRPSPRPRPSKIPRPSRKPRPSRTPLPSTSSTPPPSPSNTPAPSQSNTPSPSPSRPPLPKCTQTGCRHYEGHDDYYVIGNSMSYDEDRENCAIKSSSSAYLDLPHGAVVKKAILYWSASGRMTKAASTYLNGYYVAASRTYYGGSNGYYFYGAEADVTHLVKGSADYTVSRIWYDNRGRLCLGNAAYAAWSMVIVYESNTLPLARINVCTDNFKFTFPSGTYSSIVKCTAGSLKTVKAKTTVVTFESDNYKGEHFYINGNFLGDNLFRGQTAPNLDILTFDITNIIRRVVSSITYTIKSYYVRTRFGGAIEGLLMPVRVVYYTLPH